MEDDIKLEIGERVRKIRTDIGLSREQLSEMLGISSLFLGYIECGQRGMSITTLCNLCKKLNVSADYILFGREQNTHGINDILVSLNGMDEKYYDAVEECINNLKKLITKIENKQ
ncbi:MAG: helix-turn-helix domain-containing protein [Clostridia bacterium]|nr:helix-turn-helix domain-containing protein [Clostridia bacterium]